MPPRWVSLGGWGSRHGFAKPQASLDAWAPRPHTLPWGGSGGGECLPFPVNFVGGSLSRPVGTEADAKLTGLSLPLLRKGTLNPAEGRYHTMIPSPLCWKLNNLDVNAVGEGGG